MEVDYFKYIDNFSKYKDVKSKVIIKGKIKDPKITIAIPTYKRNSLIKDALNSALDQINFDNYEVIIVDNDDDFNNKELENILREYNNEKISYYKNEKNIGMFGNWNRCIELAKGEYFVMLHDDDWLENNFLITISKYIKDKRAIYCLYKIKDFRKNKSKMLLQDILKIFYKKIKQIKKIRELKLEDFFTANRGADGILFNRKAMIFLGGYNEMFFPSSDYYFNTHYCLKYGSLQIKRELFNYRIEKNESLKRETILLFLKKDKELRKYLVKNYLKEKYINQIEILNEINKKNYLFWGINLPYNNKLYIKQGVLFKIKEMIKDCFF